MTDHRDHLGSLNDEGALDSNLVREHAMDDHVPNEQLEAEVESKLHGYEEGFRHRHPGIWWLTLFLPFLLLGAAILACGLFRGWDFAGKLVAAAVATFFVLGRFVILAGNPEAAGPEIDVDRFSFLTSTELFSMVTFLDLVTALLVAFHIGALFRAPLIGKRVTGLVDDARFVLDSMPWMRRLAFIGLTLFVAFPLAATGAIGGSILGTLLGLSRLATFIATVLGCLLGNFALYAASDLIHKSGILENPYLKSAGIVLIIGLIIVMEVRYRRQKKRHAAAHRRSSIAPRAE